MMALAALIETTDKSTGTCVPIPQNERGSIFFDLSSARPGWLKPRLAYSRIRPERPSLRTGV